MERMMTLTLMVAATIPTRFRLNRLQAIWRGLRPTMSVFVREEDARSLLALTLFRPVPGSLTFTATSPDSLAQHFDGESLY